jgi:hypothetical protein
MCHTLIYQKYLIECGDGSCTQFGIECKNKRDVVLKTAFWSGANISDECRLNIGYFSRLMCHLSNDFVEDCFSPTYTFMRRIKQYCPELIELPPILFGHVRFIYTNNQTLVRICDTAAIVLI